MEGARVRLPHRVHRARRQGQRGDAVLLPLAHLPSAQPRRAEGDEGLAHPRARRRVQGEHRRRARVAFAERHPNARVTGDFAEMLADDELDAVVIATPVPTHYPLAKQALEAGKHVFVEKPPAMRAAEMDDLVSLSEERDLVLMPG